MKNKIVKILFLTVVFIAFTNIHSMATIHSSDPKVNTDSTVSITLTSTEELDNYNVSLTDAGGLTFKSVSSNSDALINGSMVGYMSLTKKVTTLATYTFTAPSTPGKYYVTFDINGTVNRSIVTVTAKESENEGNNENTQPQENEVENETAQQTEEIPEVVEQKKSSNANLSNLGIRPNDFKGFKPGTLNYSVTVPNDVEKINVYATTQDKSAKITSGTGNQNLKVGDNAIKVVVAAEDGTEKVYTINVTREEKKEEEKKEEENQTSNEVVAETAEEENKEIPDLKKLEIEGYKLTPSFSADVYEYKLNVSENIESLNVLTEGANEKVTIEVAGNKEIKDGENLITILVYNSETKKNSTYQILVNKTIASETTTEDVNPILNSTIKKAKRNRYIVIGVLAFILIGIIVFIIAKRRYEEDDDDEDEDYDYSEKIDLNEEDGLFRRVNREDFKIENNNTNNQNNADIEKTEEVENTNNTEDEQEDEEERNTRKKGKHF